MSKKQIMELNGIANLHILIDQAFEQHVPMITKVEEDIKQQLDLLERYMVAYNKAISSGTQTPYWHEILANPKAYPLNRES